MVAGDITIDGSGIDWQSASILYETSSGDALYGAISEGYAVFALESLSSIGTNTTVWLDTDLDASTGYQIWGFAGGAEYNIEILSDGTAALYSGGAGETFVADVEVRSSADNRFMELAVLLSDVGVEDGLNVLADINNTVFLPGDYAAGALTIASVFNTAKDNSEIRVGIVYSETTASNFFDITKYSQLFMSAQNQVMQAGIPFDLLSEADLRDYALIADYDALVFPGFSHVETSNLNEIRDSLTKAVAEGIGIIAVGNFLTNDETGQALTGNTYELLEQILGVSPYSFGSTQGITITASSEAGLLDTRYQEGSIVTELNLPITYSSYQPVNQDSQTLFNQIVNDGNETTLVPGVIAGTTLNGRNVHFASSEIFGNTNLLHEAVDWVAKDAVELADIGIQISRQESIFYSRNDMDISRLYADVALNDPGVYDLLIPIIRDWNERFDFVGSFYVNIGAKPPLEQTDWSISGPYFQELIELGNEIGTHSYTHPEDTNLLQVDSPEIIQLLSAIDPSNPNAVELSDLNEEQIDLLTGSFSFQFGSSAAEISSQLGIQVHGAALPGAPETLDTAREVSTYFDYISGGYSGYTGGYNGAFGFLTSDLVDTVYLAPNMPFDFNLIDFLGMDPRQAEEVWLSTLAAISSFGSTPIIGFPWHDYGPTSWSTSETPSGYNLEMFEALIQQAYVSGTEFVTGADLAARIDAFSKTTLALENAEGTIIADVEAGAEAGHFSLEFGSEIAHVEDWYAWSGSRVFLPQDGGLFRVTLGAEATDVTRISNLPSRAELVRLDGDGKNLNAEIDGGGVVSIDLAQQSNGEIVLISGGTSPEMTDIARIEVLLDEGADALRVQYEPSTHSVTELWDVLIGTLSNDTIFTESAETVYGNGGNDTFVITEVGRPTTILDFNSSLDQLVFITDQEAIESTWQSSTEILANFVSIGDGVTLIKDGQRLLTLEGTSLEQLDDSTIIIGYAETYT